MTNPTRIHPAPPAPIGVTFQSGASAELIPDPDGTTMLFLTCEADTVAPLPGYPAGPVWLMRGALLTPDDLRALADACVEAGAA